MRKTERFMLMLVLAGTASSAIADKTETLAAEAHLDMAQARVIALKTSPGTIIKEELEKESGGSGLRYSFDIRTHGTIHEVGVDARDGKVLENSVDKDND